MRKKPFTKKYLIFTILMLLLTGGAWFLIFIPWEIYRHAQK